MYTYIYTFSPRNNAVTAEEGIKNTRLSLKPLNLKDVSIVVNKLDFLFELFTTLS